MTRSHIEIACCCIISFMLGGAVRMLADWIRNGDNAISWNGGIYTGDVLDGIPNGDGRFVKGNATYTGFWTNGELANGQIETDELTYNGDVKGTRFDGYGVALYKDNRAYWGYWKNDYKEGLGLYRDKAGAFTFGLFENGIVQNADGKEYNVGDRVYGIDVSKHQGIISWQDLFLSCTAKGEVVGTMPQVVSYMQPVMFAFIKSTQGTTLKDACYENNYAEAKRCGKLRGVYHFLTLTAPGKEQAKFFIANTTLAKGDFPPILDLEKNNSDKPVSDQEFAAIIPIAKEWIAAIKAHYRVNPIIYTNMHIYNKFVATDHELSKYDLWLAAPGTKKPEVDKCIVWQFSHSGKVNGINDNIVDINLFNGNYKEMENYVRSKGIK